MRTAPALAIAAGLLAGAAGQASAAGNWTDEPVPSSDRMGALIAASSEGGETWAFGYGSNGTTPIDEHSTAYHRDAGGWREVSVPNTGRLTDGAVVARDDVWAVGSAAKGGGSAVRWDGARWQQVGLAAPGGGGAPRPTALKAFGPRDMWAVGGLWGSRGMAQHWDGAQWTDVPVPQESSAPWTLQDVDGTAPDDVWAVGYVSEPYHAVAVHWDGRTWQDVPVPDGSGEPGDPEELTDVLAVAPNDVWVGGQFGPRSTPTPFTAHWDGAQWTVVGLGSRTGTVNELVRVDGRVQLFGSSVDGKPFVLRHDGTAWRDAPAPSGNVYSATVRNGADVLGVGASGEPGYERPYASTQRR